MSTELYVKEGGHFLPAPDAVISSVAGKLWGSKGGRPLGRFSALSKAKQKSIVADRRKGLNYRKLVERHGVSRGTVYNVLKERAPELLVPRTAKAA